MVWMNPGTEEKLLEYCETHKDFPVQCQIRYQTVPTLCCIDQQSVYQCRLEKEVDSLLVISDTQMRAVTPGQICVFYDGDVCLGGGKINLEAH